MTRYSDVSQKATLKAAKDSVRRDYSLSKSQRDLHALVIDDIIERIDAAARARVDRDRRDRRSAEIADVMRAEIAR